MRHRYEVIKTSSVSFVYVVDLTFSHHSDEFL